MSILSCAPPLCGPAALLVLETPGTFGALQGRLAEAVTLEGENSGYSYACAVALHLSGQVDEAIGVLKRALSAHPGDPQAQALLASLSPRRAGSQDRP